ncbi:hypothetical protein MRX96_014418 [Rhipicephalus microplus]
MSRKFTAFFPLGKKLKMIQEAEKQHGATKASIARELLKIAQEKANLVVLRLGINDFKGIKQVAGSL